MDRHTISDEKYQRIQHLLPAGEGKVGRPANDSQLFINAVLYILGTGSPWRDLPKEYGHWNTVYKRFDNWCRLGIWNSVMQVLNDQSDEEVAMLDSTIMRAHQHAAGAVKKGYQPKLAWRSKAWGVPVAG